MSDTIAAAGELEKKAKWVRRETLRLHKLAPETPTWPSLACPDVEIFVAPLLRRAAEIRPEEP